MQGVHRDQHRKAGRAAEREGDLLSPDATTGNTGQATSP